MADKSDLSRDSDASEVTVLPDAGRDEMVRRMIHGTNARTGEPNRALKHNDWIGRRVVKARAAVLRRVRPKRRRYTRKP